MLRFPVSDQKQADLIDRMRQLRLAEGEIEESYFKASSPGGQKANKTLSGVNLIHRPSGVRVRCQRVVKAERLREEKDRRRRGSRKRPTTLGAGSFIPTPDAVFDLAKAMAAYYLRPLAH